MIMLDRIAIFIIALCCTVICAPFVVVLMMFLGLCAVPSLIAQTYHTITKLLWDWSGE